MTLDLPLPPSANDYWVIGWHRRKPCLVLSREARAYKAAIAIRGHLERRVPLEGPVSLALVVHFANGRSDLSNRIKVLEDALQGVAYRNDRQVVRLIAEAGPRAYPPSVEVEVLPWPSPAVPPALKPSTVRRPAKASSRSATSAAPSSPLAVTANFIAPPKRASPVSTDEAEQS